MACEVKIIEDSINPDNGIRLTTVQLKYWRAIHSEVLTHRIFSRSASSSRAIPLKKTIKQVWNDPAGPSFWGKNKSGMQSDELLSDWERIFAQFMWRFASKTMCILAYIMNIVKPHKQIINRILEPWQYISVIITATEWENFFELRTHKDAQPEFQELALKIRCEMDRSVPVKRYVHLPYITEKEWEKYSYDILMKLSTARCARVSYRNHEGKDPSYDEDIRLYNRLVGSNPKHFSPAEHQAISTKDTYFHKNFRGWMMNRELIENEEKQKKGESNGTR